MTASDWKVLHDPHASWNKKCMTLVERGMKVGCVDANPQTRKWALATLLLAHYEEMPTPNQIHDKFIDFGQAFLAEKKPFIHEQLSEFPEYPSGLPQHIYNAAYADEAPVTVELKGVNTVASTISLRSTNKLLTKGKKDCTLAREAFVASKVKRESEFVKREKLEPPIKQETDALSPVRISVDQDEHNLMEE